MHFDDDHRAFRDSVRGVIRRTILPHVERWEEDGAFPAHQVFGELGKAGLLGLEYDREFGGEGADHSFKVVLGEELGRIPCGGVPLAITVQVDMSTPSLHEFGTDELKHRFLAPAIGGSMVSSIAVTEPDAGSDVAALRTRAVRDGDHWVINGAKTYITNGAQADWICLLARTSDEGGYRGMSQIVVPTDIRGFEVRRTLRKLGNRCSDTAELSFTDLRVPVNFTIGTIGRGFQQQMWQFERERMIACYLAVGAMQAALERTVGYLRTRSVFGEPLLANQHIQYRLAELDAELEALRQLNYGCAEALIRGENIARMSSIAKLKAGRLQREVADACLQLHGGIGYMEELWTARFFRDARLLSIGGGADEVMLRTISRLSGFTP
ncbi:MAG TPA: acyl-CoA dehydrogenase family protein [Pseudonocardia sp.]